MFKISLLEGVKNIDKNKTMTYLTVFLFAFLFLLQGYTYSYYSVSKIRSNVAADDMYLNYELYHILHDSPLAVFYFEDNFKEITREIYEFREALDQIEHLKYVCEVSNTVDVLNFKGDPKVFTDPDNNGVYALIVSPNFHNVESYRVIKGRDFTDDDLIYERGKPRPALLGYKYIDVYEIGDIITIADNSLFFSGLVSEFEVIGFLEEDTTVVEKNGFQIYDLDNYMVLPSITLPWDEYVSLSEEFDSSIFHKYIVQNVSSHFSLFENKLYVESEYEDEVLTQIQNVLNDCSNISQLVRLHNSGQASLKRASRTEALTEFFAMITAVAMTFAVATVLISITNRVSRNMKDYAIHITVGATRGNTVLFVVAEMAIILTCSMILGLIATKWMMYYINMPFYFWRFLGVYALTSVVVLVLSAIVARIAMRKYDICTLIK